MTKEEIAEAIARCGRWTKPEIQEAAVVMAEGFGLNVDLFLRQVQAESSFRHDVISSAGCYGPCQLHPRWYPVERYAHPIANIYKGAEIMASYLKLYKGDTAKALAAYNCGPGRLSKALQFGDEWRKHIPAETKLYLERILGKEDEA